MKFFKFLTPFIFASLTANASFFIPDGAVTNAKLADSYISSLTSVTPVAADYVSLADASDSNKKKKASVAALRNAVYRSVTTTDSVGADDETMKLSGASFTTTLPTAVGVEGKRYTFIHAGTSLTQLYTIATTSAQTVCGVASGSYILSTAGEILSIQSDGANWICVFHQTQSGPNDAGTMYITASSAYVFSWTGNQSIVAGDTYTDGSGNTFTVTTTANTTSGTFSGTGTPATTGTLTRATGTGVTPITWTSRTITGAPAKPSVVNYDKITWERRGKFSKFVFRYRANSGSGGAAGSGDYIFTIPTGMVFDSTYVQPLIFNTAISSINNFTWRGFGGCNAEVDSLTGSTACTIVPYSSTQFKVYTRLANGNDHIFGSGIFALNAVLGFEFEFEVPIEGWQP